MKQSESTAAERKTQKDTMADWALFIGVPFGNLEPLKGFKLGEAVGEEFMAIAWDLVAKGCDGNALMTALNMANTVQVPPFPSAARVKAIAKRMRDLAKDISELEKTNFLVWQTRQIVRQSKLSEDDEASLVFPHFALPKWLGKRAEMYDEWLKMARKKIPPRRELFRRVRHVYPVLYVKWATGRPYYDKVATLLRLAGIVRISAAQLDREVRAFERDYRMATSDIQGMLQMVHKHKLSYWVD
jgi:hypothetical protein